ncbi:class I adenylate-forming enzyme family protein [Nocardioides humi]|uniref:Long-chain fatty acid--CoA ligase n=1 Tax=Nocardioides humi TaxID=449461 RepID=A0ABN2AYT9_9ACTN|nr:class I adenylate-forming enzyme family protein [Nocardioides humi]
MSVERCAPEPRFIEVIEAHAAQTPEAMAVEDECTQMSYAQLWMQAMEVAGGLGAVGVQPGQRVALAVAPSAHALATVLGCMIAGVAAAPINPRFTTTEVDAYFEVLAPSLLIGDAAGGPLLDEVDARRDVRCLSIADLCRPADAVESKRPVVPVGAKALTEAPAIIFGTGGTTGLPKAAAWSHESLWLYGAACAHALEVRRTDVELFFSPFFHIALATGPLGTLFAGGRVQFLAGFDAARVNAEIATGRVTRFFAPPTALVRLMEHPSFDRTKTGRVRRILFGSTRSEPSLIGKLTESFPSTEFITGYGATEFGGVLRLRSWERSEADGPDVLGWPVPGVHVRIVGPDGEDLPIGASGEIVARAPWQMDGYLGEAGTNESAFVRGGVRSGDLGLRRADGSILMQGRVKDLIITGGENVFPIEVESVLSRHRDVHEAAVFGVPDPDWGERVEAAVVLGGGLVLAGARHEDELRNFARTHLASYKTPKRIHILDSMPLTPAMKIDKRALRERFAGVKDRDGA